MYDELVKRLREESIQWCANCVYKSEESHICHAPEEPSCDIRDRLQAADAIESLKHTVEILCGAKFNLVRCCECIYQDDESQYHYCRKWGRNCSNDSDFFCKWGKRKDGGHDE